MFFTFLLNCWTVKSQNDSINIWKPYILANHPLQIFNSRINHNFSLSPRSKHNLSFTMSRGNVWLPKVDAFHLINSTDQNEYESVVWHHRQGKYEESILKPETLNESLEADGVFSTYYLEWSGPLYKKWDFNIGLKINQINKGKPPYSFLTSDALLEWFHTNVAGGEDPFARRQFDFNQNSLHYSDKNNNELNITNNKLLLTEFGSDLYYYPNIRFLKENGIHTNIGLHTYTSIIESTFNLDLGMAITLSKVLRTTRKSVWTMGIAGSSLAPKLIQTNQVQIQNKLTTNSIEAHWNYILNLKKNRKFILGINYHLQGSINRSTDLDHAILSGDRKSSHWNYAIKKQYEPLQGWTFIGSLKTKRFMYSTFFREDFVVDNSPDFQVGWGISYQFN